THTYRSGGTRDTRVSVTDQGGASTVIERAVQVVAGRNFFFAEGTVRPGFVEYISLQNPGGADATATLGFQASDDGGHAVAVADDVVALPARSRVTVNVNQYVA